MSITILQSGPYVHAIGWTQVQECNICVAKKDEWNKLDNPFDFNENGSYALKSGVAAIESTDISLLMMRSSGVARARSAAKATIFAALLSKQLLNIVSGHNGYHADNVGIAVASSSATIPIAWSFEAIGVQKGWDKTDTMLLPSSIPSAITTQISAALDTHASAIAFQDGILGICAAIEYAYLSFLHHRAKYFLIIGVDEICHMQCNALVALSDTRPHMDGASGLILTDTRSSMDDWQLLMYGQLVKDEPLELSDEWLNATTVTVEMESGITLFSAPIFSYALHNLFLRSNYKCVLICKLPERGCCVLGFQQSGCGV